MNTAVTTPPEIQPYAETGLDEKPRYTGEPLTYQAERIDGGTKAVLKSAQSIRNEVDQSSPDTVPFHPYYRRLNVIGGSSWRYAGQSITWEIEVPEEGLYALSFRARNVTPVSYLMCFGFAWIINNFSPKVRAFLTLVFYAPSISGIRKQKWRRNRPAFFMKALLCRSSFFHSDAFSGCHILSL